MVGICKLCGEEKELCKKSHIIPNFMYKDVYDEKNRMKPITISKRVIEGEKYAQTGVHEGKLLCVDCENKVLGELDRYGSLTLYSGYELTIEPRATASGIKYIKFGDIDYVKFKLFLLSILWRASISNDKWFSEVNLGPHEEIIRRMIYEGDAGRQIDYPIHIMSYRQHSSLPQRIILNPSRVRIDGGTVYHFLISGLFYIFYISGHLVKEHTKEMSINQTGELKVMLMPLEMAEFALDKSLQFDMRKLINLK